MSYQTSDKYELTFFANLTRPFEGSEYEYKYILDKSKHRINLELLIELDEDNLIDYSQYEK